jgi:trehalose 6-phosphate phosphatase
MPVISAAAPDIVLPPMPGIDWALFLDVDGTLLDIAERPDEVSVPRNLSDCRGRAAKAFDGALALVSGRTIMELDRLFGPLRLPVAGQHGAEIRIDADGTVGAPAQRVPSDALRRAVAAAASAIPGTLIEDKGFTVAVHYRADPQQGDVVAVVLADLVEKSGESVDVIAGKFVWEIRPLGADKGQAVAAFMAKAPFQGRHPVFVGDDVTDADGFAMVEQLGGLALPVGTGHRPRPTAFGDAGAVRDWLCDFVARLEGAG